MSQAIYDTKAVKTYVCNVMTQPGETEEYTVSEHIKAIHNHAKLPIIDYCIVNNGGINSQILKKYHEDGADQVMIDVSKLKRMGVRVIDRDLVTVTNNLIRHDTDKLAKAIMDIFKVH